MSTKLKQYLDDICSHYEGLSQIREVKEQLFHDLQERLDDLKNAGYDEEAAFTRTVASNGDISEPVTVI